jgi:transposase
MIDECHLLWGDILGYLWGRKELREYLNDINQDLSSEEWQIICTKFAPNAPEQNPVEDIWLQGKNLLRKFHHLCKSFKVVKWLFKFFLDGQIFDFPKLYQYGILPQAI